MRYHSPFMMKSDKSPPSSELSTRSSYQGQSLIKTGTYLHDGGIPLGKSKPNVPHATTNSARVYAYVYTMSYYVYACLQDGAFAIRHYVIRRATGFRIHSIDAKKRRTVVSFLIVSGASYLQRAWRKMHLCGRQAENWLFNVAENCFPCGQQVLFYDEVFATCTPRNICEIL